MTGSGSSSTRQGGREELLPHPLLHRRAPRLQGRGHDEPRRGSSRNSTAPIGSRPSRRPRWRWRRRCTTRSGTRSSPSAGIARRSGDREGPPTASSPTGVSALPRPRELAAAARGAEAHGPRGPYRQRQAPPHPLLAADGDGRHAGGGGGRRKSRGGPGAKNDRGTTFPTTGREAHLMRVPARPTIPSERRWSSGCARR